MTCALAMMVLPLRFAQLAFIWSAQPIFILWLYGLRSLLLSWYANYRKETTTLARNHLAAELAWARGRNSAKLRRPVVGCRRRDA
jgi:hypothetical protein